MKKRFLHLILPGAALVLEMLPYGAVCNFARPAEDGSIGYFRQTYAYFDLTPFGYANFAPLITAILTCAVLAMLAGYCVTGKTGLATAARNTLWVCAAFSFGPLVFGLRYYSVVGFLISAALAAELIVLYAGMKKQKNTGEE
ncbi:MAG: hypothetical protein IJW94_03305 [Oscillospiraceae bacterium]|nr:hypothetical protein [Oscillospiraceae bacterium]